VYGEVEYFSEFPVRDSLFFAKVMFPDGLLDHALPLTGKTMNPVDARYGTQYRLEALVDTGFHFARWGTLPIGSHHQVGGIHIGQQIHGELVKGEAAKDECREDQDYSRYGSI